MTRVYFVRHAQPDFSIQDDLLRPLTEKGIADSEKVTKFLLDKQITKIFSSPYKRAYDTIKSFAEKSNLNINIIDDFRERKIDDIWLEDFNSFAREQWNDFDYKREHGESLNEVQKRNISTLHEILEKNSDENIVIGTHGTALSTIINYYDRNFNYSCFERIKPLMPHIVYIDFEGTKAKIIKELIV
ncbi:histidine phosphatase family protein [Proteiniborus sp. MB09-C3]|uniref:histidine phosphatase family protein n=1 Tax=Proteiniborus sp. MB09-C3 TaxID=3050072 RepID=UPI00255286D8|nr:histidine phosphatase family protein [Proteiniborus sp. MB09-C3]WIV11574.1 histidine phosphatase family protein [Proteiniborus sp. MB09-C3]